MATDKSHDGGESFSRGLSSRRTFLKAVGATNVAATAGLAGCLQGDSGGGNTIKFGATVPESGQFSAIAGPFGDMYDNWAEKLNAEGGLSVDGEDREVEFIWYDGQSSEDRNIRLYTRLVEDDQVDVLIGPYATPSHVAITSVVEGAELPFITTTSGAPPVYNQDIKGIFTPIALIIEWAQTYFEMVEERGEAESIGFVVSDQAYAQGLFSGAKESAQNVGLEVVNEEITSPGTQDFSPVISSLAQESPDIVVVSSFAPFAATFVKQAHAQDLNPNEYHVPQLIKAFVDSVGEEVANYMTGEWYWLDGLDFEGYYGRDFFLDILDQTGITNRDYPWAAVHYYALEVAGAGIEEAGTAEFDPLVSTLNDLTVDTISGPTQFRDFGPFQNIGTILPYPVQIQDGEYHVIYPEDVATAEYEYPMP